MFEFVRAKGRAFSLASFGVALTLPLLSAHVAFAQQACGDSICPKGFTCETGELPCPDIACEGPDCKACTPGTYSSCAPAPCKADSECADGMVCATLTQQECTDDPSQPLPCAGDACPEPKSANCTPTISHECVPRWSLPCTTSADCGAGFSCEEQQECSCSGSGGGSAPGSSGTGGAASSGSSSSSESCSCQPSAEKACKVVVVACTSDAACVPGFTCETNPSGACWSSSDGRSSCEPVDPAKLCTPPYGDLFGGGGVVTRDESSATDGSNKPAVSGHDEGLAIPSGGCSVTRVGGAGDAAPLLLALGAAVTLSRRRRSR